MIGNQIEIQKIHKNIRYYFLTARITKKEASVEFYPTLDMIEDYFTKKLQVSQFCWYRNIILVIHEDEIPLYNVPIRVLLEEKEKEEAQKYAKHAGD